jgi:hypothetical protein
VKFPDIKQGNWVAVIDRHSLAKRQVTRVTPAQFEVSSGSKFMRKSGTRIGASDWYGGHAEPWGPEHDRRLLEMKAERARAERISKLRAIHWAQMGDGQISKAVEALTALGVLTEERT